MRHRFEPDGERHHLRADRGGLPFPRPSPSGSNRWRRDGSILDARSRRIVGRTCGRDLRTRIVLDALDMALAVRKPDNVIHHSDKGGQHTSLAFGIRCRAAAVRPSTGSAGDACDNAVGERFLATLACELIDRPRLANRAEAQIAVLRYIEGFCNPPRRHSSIGHRSPAEFEAVHQPAHAHTVTTRPATRPRKRVNFNFKVIPRSTRGSSPRLRGTPRVVRAVGGQRRFIPAPAGNTCVHRSRPHAAPVHPRACGEHNAAGATMTR